MRNVKEIELQVGGIPVAMCYGKKAYSKYVKKITSKKPNKNEFIKAGRCITLVSDNGAERYVIYINNKTDDIYFLKSTLVHEITHLATYVMKYLSIEDDEFRAYLTDCLYLEFVKFLDKRIK